MKQAKIVFKKYVHLFFEDKASYFIKLVFQISASCLLLQSHGFMYKSLINLAISNPAASAAFRNFSWLVFEEKQTFKDYQLIQGLSLKSYYLGIILSNSFTVIIWAIFNQLIVLICLRYINDIYFSIESLYFLLECLFYSISITSYILCLGSLFQKNQYILLFFFIILFIMNYYIMEFREEFWAILLQRISPINLIFTRYFHYVTPDPKDLSVFQTLIIFSIQSFFGFLLYIYFDQVIPNKNQTHQNIFFFFKYLKCKKKNLVSVSELELNDNIQNVQNLLEDHQINEQFDRMAIVEIDSLVKLYQNQEVVINNFNLNLYNNELMCLLGPNGSGKSTIIKLISGFINKNSGKIKVNKFDIDESLEKLRKSIGVCFQGDYFIYNFSVYDNIRYFAQLALEDQTQLEIKIDNLLSICQLKEEKRKLSQNLSLGSKRKLSLALALLRDPPILILDEPTVGLDPISKGHIWNLLRKLKQRKCILMTTQYLDEAEELADVIGVLYDGKLQVQGQLDEIKEQLQIGNYILIKCQSNEHQIQVLDQIKNYFQRNSQIKIRILTDIVNQIKVILAQWKHYELIDFFLFLEIQKIQFSYEVSTLNDIYFQILTNTSQNNQTQVNPLQSELELFDGNYPENKVISQLCGLLLRRLILIKQQELQLSKVIWSCVKIFLFYKLIQYGLDYFQKDFFFGIFNLFLQMKIFSFQIMIQIPIQDNQIKIKQLLVIHGARPKIYWISNFLIFLLYLMIETIIFAIIISLNDFINVTTKMLMKILILNVLTSINLNNQFTLLTLIKGCQAFFLFFVFGIMIVIHFIVIEYFSHSVILETIFPLYSYCDGLYNILINEEIYLTYLLQMLSALIYFWILIFFENQRYKLPIDKQNDGIKVNEISMKLKERTILENISFNIQPSQIFGLIGPNGVGKTTLLEIMVRQQKPISGSVKIGNDNIQVGYIPQNPILMQDLTVSQHLTIFGLIKGLNRTKIKQFIDRYCQEVMLSQSSRADNLSGGEQKKLAFGICLIGGSERLIMDEPTAGGDQIFKIKFKEILLHHQQKQKSSILITTNLMSEAQELCNTLGIMIKGKLQFQGSFENLRAHFLNKTYISLNIYRYIKQDLLKILNENFNNMIQEMLDERFDYFSFLLPDESFEYSQILEILLKIKDKSSIKRFQIRKLTLDQLFKLYVKEQTEQRLNEQNI